MPTIDNIYAALTPGNVGIGQAQFDPKTIRGALIVPTGFKITAAQLSTLQTTLTAAALADGKAARIYPLAGFVEFTDGSEKAVEQTFGYGGKVVVRDGIYNWSFQFVKGGKTLNDALRTFNGSAWDFFFVDANNVLMGTYYADPSTGALGLKAIPSIQIYTNPFMLNDGKKIAEYKIDFSFDSKYLNERGHYIADAGFDILDTVQGIQDVVLTSPSANGTAGTYNVQVITPLGVNLGDQYGNTSGLVQAACWQASDPVTGSSIALKASTPIAYDSTTKTFAVSLLTTDTVYTAITAPAKIAINIKGPTALAAAGVVGFESKGAVSITKN